MRVLVTGATGAIGRFLVPRLLDEGHAVVAVVRPQGNAEPLTSMGVEPAMANPLDRDELIKVVVEARPEVIVHQLTALAGMGSFRRLDRHMSLTNRFRTEVTDSLLQAARSCGTARLVAQSFCGWTMSREGGWVKTEEDPLLSRPPANFVQTLDALRYLEEAVRRTDDLEALALRYGFFYGPGTGIAPEGSVVESVRKRRIPLIGAGRGVWSFVHVRDAAGATALAVTQGAPGIYNVVDDDPAPVSEWLPYLAEVLGAKPPRRAPEWLARIVTGAGGASMMTVNRGATNRKAKSELDWEPAYPSWRQGFVDVLGDLRS